MGLKAVRLTLVLAAFLLLAVYLLMRDSAFSMLYLSAAALGLVLLSPLLLTNIKWYEPISALFAMMSLFVLDLLYMAYTGFSEAEHLAHALADVGPLAADIGLFSAAWAMFFFAGYAIARKDPGSVASDSPIVSALPPKYRDLCILAVVMSFVIGITNFAYNVWLFNPGAPLDYFLDFGISRYREQVNPGLFTTLGYNFFIVALVLYRCSFRGWSAMRFVVYSALAAVSMFAIISRGQIFYTFSILIFLFLVEYLTSSFRARVVKFAFFALPIVIVVVLSAYALRMLSVKAYLAQSSGEEFDLFHGFWIIMQDMIHLVFGKGNVPNFPAMMVYWQHYGTVEPYLYGASLLNWLGGFVPALSGSYLGYAISDTWYPNHVGGVPPGVILEFYSNFGIVGALAAALIFGGLSAFSFNYFMATRNVVLCIIFAALVTRFWFIIPKVETATLSNAIWLCLPSIFVLLSIFFFQHIQEQVARYREENVG